MRLVHLRELARSSSRRGERNGVVEREAERLVGLLSAGVVEQVLDDVVPDWEQSTTRSVGRDMARRALNPAGERSYRKLSSERLHSGE